MARNTSDCLWYELSGLLYSRKSCVLMCADVCLVCTDLDKVYSYFWLVCKYHLLSQLCDTCTMPALIPVMLDTCTIQPAFFTRKLTEFVDTLSCQLYFKGHKSLPLCCHRCNLPASSTWLDTFTSPLAGYSLTLQQSSASLRYYSVFCLKRHATIMKISVYDSQFFTGIIIQQWFTQSVRMRDWLEFCSHGGDHVRLCGLTPYSLTGVNRHFKAVFPCLS